MLKVIFIIYSLFNFICDIMFKRWTWKIKKLLFIMKKSTLFLLQEYDERDGLDYSCPKKGIVTELIVDKNCRTNGIEVTPITLVLGRFRKN